MKKIRINITMAVLVMSVVWGCQLMTPEEFDDSPMSRPDKELTAREIIAGKYPTVAVWNAGIGNFVDRKIFATFDSLLNMYPQYESLFSSLDPKRTFMIPTNRAFDVFYKGNGQKVGYVSSGKRKYLKLADIPDSTRQNIILNAVLEKPLHTSDLTDVAQNFKTLKGVNITLKTDNYGVLTLAGVHVYNNDASGKVVNYNAWSITRTSNLEPKNGVLHVWDVIPFMDERNFHIGSTFVPLQ